MAHMDVQYLSFMLCTANILLRVNNGQTQYSGQRGQQGTESIPKYVTEPNSELTNCERILKAESKASCWHKSRSIPVF